MRFTPATKHAKSCSKTSPVNLGSSVSKELIGNIILSILQSLFWQANGGSYQSCLPSNIFALSTTFVTTCIFLEALLLCFKLGTNVLNAFSWTNRNYCTCSFATCKALHCFKYHDRSFVYTCLECNTNYNAWLSIYRSRRVFYAPHLDSRCCLIVGFKE